MMNIEHEKLMTIDEVSEYLQVKKRTVYDWLKKGRIPAIKTVGQWRFRRDQIDEWLQEHHG
jgi:excisionase family DNA binding protein